MTGVSGPILGTVGGVYEEGVALGAAARGRGWPQAARIASARVGRPPPIPWSICRLVIALRIAPSIGLGDVGVAVV